MGKAKVCPHCFSVIRFRSRHFNRCRRLHDWEARREALPARPLDLDYVERGRALDLVAERVKPLDPFEAALFLLYHWGHGYWRPRLIACVTENTYAATLELDSMEVYDLEPTKGDPPEACALLSVVQRLLDLEDHLGDLWTDDPPHDAQDLRMSTEYFKAMAEPVSKLDHEACELVLPLMGQLHDTISSMLDKLELTPGATRMQVLQLQLASILAHQGVLLRRIQVDGLSELSHDEDQHAFRPAADALPRTGRELFAWQTEALDAWEIGGRVGVVQAVTGTGKTQVGIEAAHGELEAGGQVLVLVPTVALLSQWQDTIREQLPGVRIGLRGDGHRATFTSAELIVSTVQSARNLMPPTRGLLVADECHRYGAESWAATLNPDYDARLGLSATYERGDDGDVRLATYFGARPVYDIDYARAIDDGVVAEFKLAFVGVALTRIEQADYEEASLRAGRAKRALTQDLGLRSEPFAEFMKDVSKAANGKWPHSPADAHQQAIRFLSNFTKLRRIVAETASKTARLRDLIPVAEWARGTLVFTQTVDAAQDAARLFKDVGAGAAAIYGGMESGEREHLLRTFKQGAVSVLSAPRVLDEGVDVPDADLGIVVSASSSRRQMIQRMGRVLRRKTDGRLARLVVLYAEGTMEDPAKGAHQSFIDIAWDVAAEAETFPARSSPEQLRYFLG